MKMEKNFKFFIPVTIEKAESGKNGEKSKMMVKGIASTLDKDSDGEILDPNGFDLGFFMKSGFLNWHHQSKGDPSSIVGEPTKAEVRNNELYIEGELYNDSPLAQKVWDLGQLLEKSGSKRRLGFSVEGSIIETNPVNKKYITKARIIGCAITPTPKNSNTLMNIMKGEFIEDEELEFDIEKSVNGGEIEYIIDITKPNGERVTVDKSFNIKIEKGLDTDSGRALIPEDVEGKKQKKEALTVIAAGYEKGLVSEDTIKKIKEKFSKGI